MEVFIEMLKRRIRAVGYRSTATVGNPYIAVEGVLAIIDQVAKEYKDILEQNGEGNR